MDEREQDPHEMLREIADAEQQARLAREFGLNGDPANGFHIYGRGGGRDSSLSRAIGTAAADRLDSRKARATRVKRPMWCPNCGTHDPCYKNYPPFRCIACGSELRA